MKTICVITCYRDPDYGRAWVLRSALKLLPEYNVIVIKNSHKGLLRYPEVLAKLLFTRLRRNPDMYLLTFRGYELLPFFLLLTIGKKRLYDEMINLIEWHVYEHHKWREDGLAHHFWRALYGSWLRRCDIILTDTDSHAASAAKLMGMPRNAFFTVPIGAVEEVMTPSAKPPKRSAGFTVLYNGNMLPNHGIQYVLDAALLLKSRPDIRFVFLGSAKAADAVEAARRRGAHVKFQSWIPFKELPKAIEASSLTLSGPFGGTVQSGMVVNGKTYQHLAMRSPTIVGANSVKHGLVDGKNALIVPQANARALADKIAWAADHPKKLQAIGAAGRRLYDERYSYPKLAKILESMLRSL